MTTRQDLERDLESERVRCMDLTARLDRARTELRAAEAARDEARSELTNERMAEWLTASIMRIQAGMAVVHFFDLARMHALEDAVRVFVRKACRAPVVPAPVDTRTGEATREWAVGDACEVRMQLLGDRWYAGTVSGHCLPGLVIVETDTCGQVYVSAGFLRRPIPPAAPSLSAIMQEAQESARRLPASVQILAERNRALEATQAIPPTAMEPRAECVHDLKTWPEYFAAIADGSKSFELRRDDRDYRVGDELLLREWDPSANAYTGKHAAVRVTYVLRDAEHFGLARGFVIMGVSHDTVGRIADLERELVSRQERFEALHRNRDNLAAMAQGLRTHFGTQQEVADRDARIADLERRLREAEAFMGRTASGGAIISSNTLTPTQIAIARVAYRMHVTPDGLGFVYVPGPMAFREEIEEVRADEATSLIAATEAIARAERAEATIARVRSLVDGDDDAWARCVLEILDEESGR